MARADAVYTEGYGEFEAEAIMREIAESVNDYVETLERFTDDIDFLRDSDAIDKYAHAEAHRIVSEQAFSILMAEMQEAVAKTKEYNISMYTEVLEQAMLDHKNELITIEPRTDPGRVYVEIEQNMLILGTPEEYIQAVKQAKSDLNLGRIQDNKTRSKIWKEIYRIDREGGKKIHPKTKDDITDRYVGKYFATIEERLKNIEPGTAPWWWYINFGNMPSAEEAENVGTPYPEIAPTNFVRKAELNIQYAFEDLFVDYQREAERVYSRYLQDDYGISGRTSTFQSIERDFAEQFGNDVAKQYSEGLYEKVGKLEQHKVGSIIEYNNAWYDVIKTSGGNIGLRYNLQKNREARDF